LGQKIRQGKLEVVRLFFGYRPFIGAGLDLIEQDMARPAELRGGPQVPKTGGRGRDLLHDLDVVPPRYGQEKFSHKLGENGGPVSRSRHFWNVLFQKERGGVFGVKLPHPPDTVGRESPHAGEGPPQVTGNQFHHRIAPAVRLLFLHNPPANVPVEQDGLMGNGPGRCNAGGNHPGLQFLDKLPVVGAAGQSAGHGLFYRASPSSIFSASFSSLQDSASNSLAGVGGW
jgi:hypothetical protein